MHEQSFAFSLLFFRCFRVFGIVVVVVDERGFSRRTFPQSAFVAGLSVGFSREVNRARKFVLVLPCLVYALACFVQRRPRWPSEDDALRHSRPLERVCRLNDN